MGDSWSVPTLHVDDGKACGNAAPLRGRQGLARDAWVCFPEANVRRAGAGARNSRTKGAAQIDLHRGYNLRASQLAVTLQSQHKVGP